jgi:hypothetical protein
MSYLLTPAEHAATVEKIAKINERAARKGFTGRIELTAERVERTETNALGLTVTEILFETTLTGEAPRYGGWAFLAVADWDPEAGLIVRTSPGVEAIDRSSLREGYCDHCRTDRYRKQTYIVANEAGEQRQVGSTCIKDFLGWDGRVVFIEGKAVEHDLQSGFGAYARTYATETVLAAAWACIRAHGYLPASGWGETTKEQVFTCLDPRDRADRDFAAALRPYVADAAAQAAACRAFLLSDDFAGSSEYVLNLKAIAAADHCTPKNVGILASGPQAWARHQERSLIRKAEAEAASGSPSEHFGAVKERLTLTVTIEAIRYIEGQWGTTTLYSLTTADGNVAKYFASTDALGDETGRTLTIKGTVKGHGEYRGIKETTLTRCTEIA